MTAVSDAGSPRENSTSSAPVPPSDIPRGNLTGFARYLSDDLVSGFLVSLIALPLCLGISLASGYPPVAGLLTAIVGGVMATALSNSELTIKGPAAGLIVIALGAVTDFGYTSGRDPAADLAAYRQALAVGVAAGLMQVAFGAVRAGILGDFFPTSIVHGMLAAIGVIIVLKQLPVTFGQTAAGEPLEILADLPHKFWELNPEIALIGAVSLAILFGFPWLKRRLAWKPLDFVPAPLVVLLAAVPLGIYFDLSHEHTYTFANHEYALGEQFLVNVPQNLWNAVTTPDYASLTTATGWKWVLMFALIGSLESMLSAKAIDQLDPWRRRTNLDRDLVAVGVANTAAACLGGLPMISEIVRSKANIDNGAKTRFANFWHAAILLGFVALLPWAIHRIPLAALAAMLVYTGARLASPREFVNVYQIGPEQLLVFLSTLLAVLATDLLVGVGIGIVVKLAIHLVNGVPVRSLFRPYLEVETRDDKTVVISARESAVFSNWIPFKRQIEQLGLVQGNHVVIDLAGARLIDHSVMEHLHELEQEFAAAGLRFEISGLDVHRQLSGHQYATRKRALVRLRRVTVVTREETADELVAKVLELGASGYTLQPCLGAGRTLSSAGPRAREPQVRLEVITSAELAERILEYVANELAPRQPVTACAEVVEALGANAV